MVREFADLEGVMGETYALMEGRDPEVAQAMREQFLPDAAGGVVPADPGRSAPGHGREGRQHRGRVRLRRAALWLQRPLRPAARGGGHGGHRCRARAALRRRSAGQTGPTTGWSVSPGWWTAATVVAEATAFILERLAKTLTDEGMARDTVDAVLPTSRDFLDLRRRAQALHEFRSRAHWEDLVTVFTRPSNLAKKLPPEAAAESPPIAGVSPHLFVVEAESALFAAWLEAASRVGSGRGMPAVRRGARAARWLAPAWTATSTTCW